MSKKISIKKYRKLENIEFDFSENVNLISGTNGTCKTSLLYIISNSYQKVIKKGMDTNVQNCLTIIQEINNMVNPKIETLTRGDKQFNDPAPNEKGAILNVEYFNGYQLEFRKHNSDTSDRFSIKPKYASNSNDKLPQKAIIYLGLSRLASFGEFQETNVEEILSSLGDKIENEDIIQIVKKTLESKLLGNQIKNIKKNLPKQYIQEINSIYCDFTGIQVKDSSFNKVSIIKNRADFTSNIDGIDSNTISAGEDNLYMIITALVSLKYYYESSKTVDTDSVKSILLIDELDATLHPSYQLKLYDLIKNFCNNYKIQFVGTTHSLSLLEYSLEQKDNVVYLVDGIDYAEKINEKTDFLTIKMFLNEESALKMNATKKIPIFTEDAEARIFIEKLFDYYSNTKNQGFSQVIDHFHFVKANIGSENLINIFSDSVFIKDLTKAICILDGDKLPDLNKNIISLPGKTNPEKLLIDYLLDVYSNPHYRDFWNPSSSPVMKMGYQKKVVYSNIIKCYEEIENEISNKKNTSASTKGIRRERYKKLFNSHTGFFEELFTYWINDPKNETQVRDFYSNLYKLFRKTSRAYGINPNIWVITAPPKVGKPKELAVLS
ncbi:TPA: AAA family ATPase [Bacillus thuringiensis]|nr:AAA family ATPase [Bacillus thuringiensis]HDR8186659.1 AAA family ATPase [Bacillus thuringiensis]